MLKVYKEAYDLSDLNVWSGAEYTLATIDDHNKGDELFALLEETFPDGATETEINDFLWFDRDYIFEYLGINEDEEEEED